MAKTMIDKMADRFLSWPLPKGFAPDCGISFIENRSPHCWPVGTNLLTADQAREMIVHMLPGALLEWAAATEEEGEAYMHGYYDGEAAAKTANVKSAPESGALKAPFGCIKNIAIGNLLSYIEKLLRGTLMVSTNTPCQILPSCLIRCVKSCG